MRDSGSRDPGSNPGRAIRNIFILTLIITGMGVGITFIIIAILVLAIWIFVEFKRFRHKIWAIFLIALILFTYFSFTSVIKGKDIDIKTFTGMKEAGKLYFLWIGNAFGNLKSITTNAIGMDWRGIEKINQSS